MRDTTGLSLLDLAILAACEAEQAHPTAPYRKTQGILDRLYTTTSIGPGHAHEPMLDLGRPWVVNAPLLDHHGNIGSPDDPPASPRYTETRLTPLGRAALAAERELIGPVPVGFINGSMHSGGPHPPFAPDRVAAAIRAASEGADDDTLIELVGPPTIPTGVGIEVDHRALASGDRVELRQRATIIHTGPEIVITSYPIGVGIERVGDRLRQLFRPDRNATTTPSPVRNMNDMSTADAPQLLVLEVDPDADPAPVIAELETVWELDQMSTVQLREPLPATIRRAAGGDDLEHRLALLGGPPQLGS